MQRYFGRIMRALIVSTLGFGGGVGLLVCIVALVLKGDPNAFQHGLQAGLILGGIFAVLFVCVFLPLDLTAHLFLPKGSHYEEIWELRQTRELTLDGTLNDVVKTCRLALLEVPYIGTISENLDTMVIKASTTMSWRSFGEKMEVKITPAGENRWTLRLTSASPTEKIVFDWGKNFDNVETWLKNMNSLLEEQKSKVASG